MDFLLVKWVIEKIYNGETYAQFEKYGGVKNVCLQNSWAGTIRSSCENYKETVGGSTIKGCQYPLEITIIVY